MKVPHGDNGTDEVLLESPLSLDLKQGKISALLYLEGLKGLTSWRIAGNKKGIENPDARMIVPIIIITARMQDIFFEVRACACVRLQYLFTEEGCERRYTGLGCRIKPSEGNEQEDVSGPSFSDVTGL